MENLKVDKKWKINKRHLKTIRETKCSQSFTKYVVR